jgi:hypothetical protein
MQSMSFYELSGDPLTCNLSHLNGLGNLVRHHISSCLECRSLMIYTNQSCNLVVIHRLDIYFEFVETFTGFLPTVLFIAAIHAIMVTVATPTFIYALTIITPEKYEKNYLWIIQGL